MPSHGADALHLVGHRGRDERHPPRARRDRPRPRRQVRRRLPRPRRQPPRRRGLGPRDAGDAGLRGRHRRARRGDTVVVPYNDPEAVAAAFAAHPGRIAAIIVEPVARQRRASSPPRAGLPRVAPRADRRRRRAAHLRRGDHRASGSPTAAPRRATASRPTSRRWARSSAAGCRSGPTAAGPT